jgi:hypothetical protein
MKYRFFNKTEGMEMMTVYGSWTHLSFENHSTSYLCPEHCTNLCWKQRQIHASLTNVKDVVCNL